MSIVRIHPDVAQALESGRAVVALETAVLTHGLPRSSLGRLPACQPAGWRADAPTNLETMHAMARAVRESGSVPAIIAVQSSVVCVGIDDASLQSLAADPHALKASARDLPPILAQHRAAGTTVSATLAICAMTHRAIASAPSAQSSAPLAGVRVFATGGIGGVHRGWPMHLDISADLVELARTPVCVVCSGPKAVLDVPATVEALESLGVLVLGYQTDLMPQFYSAGEPSLRVPHRVDSPAEVAEICRMHWVELGRTSAVLVCHAPPTAHALPHDEVNRVIDQASGDAASAGALAAASATAGTAARGAGHPNPDPTGIGDPFHAAVGPALTPFLLDRVAKLTGGRSLQANIALLIENAHLAGRVAAEMSGTNVHTSRRPNWNDQ